MMLNKLVYVLIISLILVIIIGETNFGNIEITEETALLPETSGAQAVAAEEPVTFAEKLAAGDSVTIVFLGDYVTSPDSLPDGNPNHVALLEKWFESNYPDQATIVNAGMNANTVSHMKQRIGSDVLNHSPDLVVISAGLNDALGGWRIPVEEYAKNYGVMLEEITASGDTEVLIRTPNPTTSVGDNREMMPYMKASEALAAANNVHFFDFYGVMAAEIHSDAISQTALMQNSLYPNTKGQAYLFDKLKVYMATELIGK